MKTLEIPNKEYKRQILRENYEEYIKNYPTNYPGTPESFREWVELESESDPNFWYWLFEVEEDGEFCPDKEEFNNFINSL